MSERTHKLSIEKDEEGIHSVSTTHYDYMKEMGYKTVKTVKQLLTRRYVERALQEELDPEITTVEGTIKDLKEWVDKAQKEIESVVKKEAYKKFVEKWDKKYRKFVGTMQKENQLNQKLGELDRAEKTLKALFESKAHYQEILDKHMPPAIESVPEEESKAD